MSGWDWFWLCLAGWILLGMLWQAVLSGVEALGKAWRGERR